MFDARVSGATLALSDINLTVEWSQFEDCHFTQQVRPVLNAHGIAAQDSFAIAPSIYRRCTFERVRFNMLSGFSLGRAVFEGCTFVHCRWEGHFAHDAWLVDNRFLGRMNGCAWYGHGQDGTNLIAGNDFTATRFTTNVAFRDGFPIDAQAGPTGTAHSSTTEPDTRAGPPHVPGGRHVAVVGMCSRVDPCRPSGLQRWHDRQQPREAHDHAEPAQRPGQ